MPHDYFCRPALRLSELTLLSRLLSTAASARQPLRETLALLSKQTTNKKIYNALALVCAELQRGALVAQAFSKYELIFGTLFCRVVAYGETAGNSSTLCAHLADYYKENELFRKKISRILKYPVLIVIGATGIFIASLGFVIPFAVRTISSYTGNLPAATSIALTAVTFLSRHCQTMLTVSIVFCAVCFCVWYATIRLQCLEKIAWRTPFCGKLCRKNSLRRISQTLSFLLTNGIPPSRALKITAETAGCISFRNALRRAAQGECETVTALSTALKAADIFPPSIIDPPTGTEEQYAGGELFKKIAEFYQEEIEAAVTAAVLVIEPAVVAIAGLLGGGVLLALYLPLLRGLGNH
jgi:type IV pilus assembly protein PilC